jgi:hypothetical protein
MSGRKAIGFSIYISLPEEVTATPTEQTVVNNYDYMGGLVTLWRLPGESNVDYKNRLWDVNVHPGGPDYEGVLNNLGREFGLLRQKALTISLKLDSAGDPVATSPRVDILANRVVLYSDWRPGGTAVIDREIRTYQPGDTGYFLDDLITAINASPYFSAVIESGIRSNLQSSTLVRQTSDLLVTDNYVRTDRFIELDYDNIVQASLSFTEKGVFDTEVAGTPVADGEYLVDYVNGTVEAYTMPSGAGSCSYHAGQFPMEIDYVPVQIFSFQDDDFQDELFDEETLDSGSQVDTLPNSEGAEIYHQLFMETKVFWGE